MAYSQRGIYAILPRRRFFRAVSRALGRLTIGEAAAPFEPLEPLALPARPSDNTGTIERITPVAPSGHWIRLSRPGLCCPSKSTIPIHNERRSLFALAVCDFWR